MAHKITDDCVACGSCLDECPVDAISEGDPIYTIDPEKCTDCGNCVDSCPSDAIEPE
jgi:ferredoxin